MDTCWRLSAVPIKYLGFTTISRDMNWSEHINNVCTKANKTLDFLKRNLKISSRKITAEKAYKSLICSPRQLLSMHVLSGTHTPSNIDRIEAIQRRAARFVMRRYTDNIQRLRDDSDSA